MITMSYDVSRRRLFKIATALPFIGIFPGFAFAQSISGSMLLIEFAKAAAAYVAQRYLSSFFSQYEGPSNAEIIAAIEKSTEDLKAYVSKDVRLALTEAQIRELKAAAQAALDELTTYSKASPQNRESYAFRLEDADHAARNGAYLADEIGEPAIAVYAMFVSLRILIEDELFRLRGDEGVYREFAAYLLKAADRLVVMVDTLLASRSPAARLGQIACRTSGNGGGGGFEAPFLRCEFTLDGKKVIASEGFTVGREDVSARLVNAAKVKYRAYERKVMEERSDLVNNVGQPMLEIAAVWRTVSSGITGDELPLFQNDPTVVFPPIPPP